MQLDKKTVDKLLALNDAQLKHFIQSLAARSGIDLSSFGVSENDIVGIRRALSAADEATLRQVSEQLGKWKKQ